MHLISTRRGIQSLPWFFCVLLLSACAGTGTDPGSEKSSQVIKSLEPGKSLQPAKSPNDEYQYRLLALDNRLQVLLISDPDAPKAAASLDVHVGSGDNPPGRAGLAHFLEHMLFLGTDKYPDSAEYERFITEHGGSHNAYTSFENTNYFFDINARDLPEALDRFAQFFIAPRFDAKYVDREKNAVEAEYQMGLKSDDRRGLDVLQEVMNPAHPYSQFSVGSLETLADRPGAKVRDDMIDFYNTYYSANIMRLAVLGSQPLDELESLVRPLFDQVPNRDYSRKPVEAPLFEEDALPLFVQVQPLATQRQLNVSFTIDDYRDDYRVKPALYLGNLVGHEGEGSLLSQLKEEGLAESLAAGAGLGWDGGALFSVVVTLTEKGAEQTGRVQQLLFAYLDMLRDEGPQERLYQEQSQLAELSFRFREQSSPMRYVSALASGMQYFYPEDVLRGPYMMEQYAQEMLVEILDQVRPDNAVVMFSDQSVEGDQVSNFYQVPYSVETMSMDRIATASDDEGVAALSLPAPNEFIAEDVSLVTLPGAMSEIPEVLLESQRQKIWFMSDAEFRVPRGVTYINFRSPEVAGNAVQSARAALYTALLTDHVNEFAYPAQLAGMHFSFRKHREGITLRLGGYTDKQELLLQRLVRAIAEPDFNPGRFEDIRRNMIRRLENSVAKRPSSQVVDDLNEALQYGVWGEQALIDALRETDLAALNDYVRGFWKDATAEALIYGNYNEDRVAQVAAQLDDLLETGVAPELPERKILKLAEGESLQYPVDVDHDDAVVAWYLQGAGDSWRDRAATALTAQVMSSGFFQQLRTEQQLGYVVGAYSFPKAEVPGLVMLVQSPVADAGGVASAMEVFLRRVLPSLDEAQFERHKVSLVSDILRPDKNQAERAEFYWQSIASKQWDFAGRDTLAATVRDMSLDDWRAYFEAVFLTRSRSLQVVAPGNQGVLPEGEFSVVESAETIKRGHEAYVID